MKKLNTHREKERTFSSGSVRKNRLDEQRPSTHSNYNSCHQGPSSTVARKQGSALSPSDLNLDFLPDQLLKSNYSTCPRKEGDELTQSWGL